VCVPYLVLESPWLLATASKAVSTSPGSTNLLAISTFKCGCSEVANNTGAVARPKRRSAAAGLPAIKKFRNKRIDIGKSSALTF